MSIYIKSNYGTGRKFNCLPGAPVIPAGGKHEVNENDLLIPKIANLIRSGDITVIRKEDVPQEPEYTEPKTEDNKTVPAQEEDIGYLNTNDINLPTTEGSDSIKEEQEDKEDLTDVFNVEPEVKEEKPKKRARRNRKSKQKGE